MFEIYEINFLIMFEVSEENKLNLLSLLHSILHLCLYSDDSKHYKLS